MDAFKREVSVPGMFEQDYPTVTDAGIVGLLGDGFAEAQLNGLFVKHVLDLDSESISPELSLAGAHVVVLFAGLNLARQNFMAESASVRYKAGPVEMQESKFSNVMTMTMKSLQDRLDRILSQSRSGSVLPFVLDGYCGRGSASSYGALSASESFGSSFGVHLG